MNTDHLMLQWHVPPLWEMTWPGQIKGRHKPILTHGPWFGHSCVTVNLLFFCTIYIYFSKKIPPITVALWCYRDISRCLFENPDHSDIQ